MKNPRDHRKWTSEEIERDSTGYLAAQQAYREDQREEDWERREADDELIFTEQFVRNGGSRSAAASAFRAHRNRKAAEAAVQADAAAITASRRRVRAAL